jgi:hypothetical protein
MSVGVTTDQKQTKQKLAALAFKNIAFYSRELFNVRNLTENYLATLRSIC